MEGCNKKSSIIIVQNNSEKNYRGYKWHDNGELSLLTSKIKEHSGKWLSRHPERSEYQYVDHMLAIVATMYKGYKKCNPDATYDEFMREVMSKSRNI